MEQRTNIEMLIFGLKHIAENHGFKAFTQDWKNEGAVCIYGGCNVPTLADVQFLCEDCGISKNNIDTCESGIDILLPEYYYDWAEQTYKKPIHEFWRRIR